MLGIWLFLAAACGAAQPPDDHRTAAVPVAEPSTLSFRRVYVPEGTIDWPKGKVRYLPMEAAEFNRLLGASQRTTPELPAQADAGLVCAEYQCRLKGQSVLQGSGTLEVSGAISGATFLTLDPCNLAIDRAHWVTSDGAPAVLGTSSDGRVQLLAERGGQMKFDWSLAAENDEGRKPDFGGAAFDIRLPPSPVSRMRLELPADVSPTVDCGVISAAPSARPAEPGFRCWDVELGGRAGCRLRLAKEQGAGSGEQGGGLHSPRSLLPAPCLLADQSAVYDFSLRCVEAAIELNVGAHREPLRNLTINADLPLQLVGVAAEHAGAPEGLQPLSTRSVGAPNPTAKPAEGTQRVIVELPPALQEGELKLHVRAVAPLPLDELWKLPLLSIEEVICRTNRIRLAVSPPICIADLSSHGCRQTDMTALKSGSGERLDFDVFDAGASLELSLTRPPPEIQAVSATNTEIGQGKMNSRAAADFRTSESPVFKLEADVLPSWTIDGVVSQPADAVDDWVVSRRGDGRRLVVHLARPLTPARPLRLIVAARRFYAGFGRNQVVKLTIDDVVPLRFAAALASPPLIDLRAGGPNELRVAAGEAPAANRAASGDAAAHGEPPWRMDVKELTPAEIDLCGYAQGDMLLRDDAAGHPGHPLAGDPRTGAPSAAPQLLLTSRGPGYTADIRLEAVVTRATLQENYRIVCTPAATAPIGRLVVFFTGRGPVAHGALQAAGATRLANPPPRPAPPGPLTWSVDGLDDTRFTARRWTPAQELAAGLTADQEAWDVTFLNRPSAPIELHAVRKTNLAGPLPLCLASLPDAAAQQAAVVVRSFGPQAVRIAARGVTPLPAGDPAQQGSAVPPDQIPTMRGAWRYDAGRLGYPPWNPGRPVAGRGLRGGSADKAARAEPAVVLTLADRAADAPGGCLAAWAWEGEIRSRFAANGMAEHLLTYNIENTGARQIVLKVPARAELHDVTVNGQPAFIPSAGAASGELPIELPPEARFVRLALCLSTSGAPLATLQRMQPPLLDVNVPVFARHWTVELPPGYCALGGSRDSESYRLRRRLLDGLARGDQEKVFDPFRGGDWRELLSLSRAEPADEAELADPLRGRPRLRGQDAGQRRAALVDEANDLQQMPGWSQYGVDVGDADSVAQRGSPSVVVVYRPAVAAAGWLLFLAIAGVGAWPRVGRPAVMLALAAVCGACALLLPAELAGAFSKGLLGIGFCVVLAIARRRPADRGPGHAPAPAAPEMPSTISNFIPYAAPVLVAVALCATRPAAAAGPPPAAPVYSVFIPVDKNQQQTHTAGALHPLAARGMYLVPEAFYSELYRRTARRPETPQGWIISAAIYRAVLAEDPAGADGQQGSSEFVVERLTADYEIRVFDTAARGAEAPAGAPAQRVGTRVRIPLRRDEVSLVPDEALLDERPVQPEWESDGAALLLDIAEPGEYRLELTLRPKVRPETGHRPARAYTEPGGFDLAIPRVPGARLEVNVPTGGPTVTVPSALGLVQWEEIPSRWIAELGPADRLAVRWRDSTADAVEALDVQQLQWLRFEPGCVLLNVRLKVKAAAGQVHSLQVKTDSSLELLPDDKNIVRQVSSPRYPPSGPGRDATQLLEFQLPQPASGNLAVAGSEAQGRSAMLDLHFLYTAGQAGHARSGSASIGTFRAPQIEVVGARPGQPWLAVSVDPSLEYQLPAGVPGASTRGPGSGSPSDAATVTDFMANWDGALVQRTGEKPPDAAFHFNGNAALWSMTTRTRKTETTADVSTQWSFDAGKAQFQFDASLTDAYPPGGGSAFQYRLELPTELRVDSLAVTAFPGHPAQQGMAGPSATQGRTVPARWFRSQDGRLSVFLIRPAGDPGREMTNDENQMSKVAPPNSNVRHSTLGLPGLAARRRLQIRGQLPVPLNGRVRLPQIRLDDVHVQSAVVRLYRREAVAVEVVAPRAGATEWPAEIKTPAEEVGRDELGQPVRAFYVDPAGTTALSVALQPAPARGEVGNQLTGRAAAPTPPLPSPGAGTDAQRWSPHVVSADVCYAWQPGGRCIAAAALDVESATAADYPLQIPAGFSLAHLTVDGVPVDVAPVGAPAQRVDGKYILPLWPTSVRTRVELLLLGPDGASMPAMHSLAGGIGSMTFPAPRLGDLDADRTSWTIAAPPGLQLGDAVADGVWSPPTAAEGDQERGLLSQWRQLAASRESVPSDNVTVYALNRRAHAITVNFASARSQDWLARWASVSGFLAALAFAAVLLRRGLLTDRLIRWPHACGIALGIAWWLWASPSALGLAIVFAVLASRILAAYKSRHSLAGRGTSACGSHPAGRLPSGSDRAPA